ncbi:MAG: hypothetical protein M5U26_30630 [Planctomycetota bacterium]|nr:hypothetical protein [Planctomycetota bacterium]
MRRNGPGAWAAAVLALCGGAALQAAQPAASNREAQLKQTLADGFAQLAEFARGKRLWAEAKTHLAEAEALDAAAPA